MFFSRITLEDKLGQQYEPYIFAALNSARVMVAIGSKPEYFNAVWVKNEWSRYLAIMAKERSRLLIPCYRGMDPYDLPEELSSLQSQDMGKIGFMQDLIRGIKKVINKEEPAARMAAHSNVEVAPAYAANVVALLKRGTMALEDGEWEKADDFFEDVLNQDAECAEAYVGKFLAQQQSSTLEKLAEKLVAGYAQATDETLEACPWDEAHIEETVKKCVVDNYLDAGQIEMLYQGFSREYSSILSCRKKQKQELEDMLSKDRTLIRALQYAKGEQNQKLDAFKQAIADKMDARIAGAEQEDAAAIADIKQKYAAFLKAKEEKAYQLKAEAEANRQADYEKHAALLEENSIAGLTDARDWFYLNAGYCNCAELAEQAKEKRDCLMAEKEAAEQEATKKKKRITAIVAAVMATVIALVIVVTQVVIPTVKYNTAVNLMKAGQYDEAILAFKAMDGYKDSAELLTQSTNERDYLQAVALMNQGQYTDAIKIFDKIIAYGDSLTQKLYCQDAQNAIDYETAILLMSEENYSIAISMFEKINGYKDSNEKIAECQNSIKENDYNEAVALMSDGKYIDAYLKFTRLNGYKDSNTKLDYIYPKYMAEKIAKAKIGDTLDFGSYVLGKKASKGKEPISWIIIKKNGNKALLLCKKPIEYKAFNETEEVINWEQCTLRKWLNGDFLKNDFSTAEQALIQLSFVPAASKEFYKQTNCTEESDTKDKIFLLSYTEFNEYCSDFEIRHGIEAYEWWLRSPGSETSIDGRYRATVREGNIERLGDLVNYGNAVVPALWIDCN